MSNKLLSKKELHEAFEADRLVLHYQPQYTARGEALVGVEALARIEMADGSLILPQQFLPVLEASPLLGEIGLELFRQACRAAASWDGLTMAINVSPLQFRDPNLPDKLVAAAAEAGVNPTRIEIEITEGVIFDNPEGAEVALSALSEAGFTITLDDFGTGYSSLGYLLRLPVKKFKLDRSFIIGLPTDVKSVSIVHALVALSRALGLKVVAEGVEQPAQAAFLRVAGCHIIQGFLYSRPLPMTEIQRLRGEASAIRPVGAG